MRSALVFASLALAACVPLAVGFAESSTTSARGRTPIVFVPALFASKFYCKWDKTSQFTYCPASSNGQFVQQWPPRNEDMVNPAYHCWLENFMLTYKPETESWDPYPGVQCIVTDPGPVQVDWLWVPFVQHLVKTGYTNGKDAVEFAYDWRVGPNEMVKSMFPRLKTFIESVYSSNGNSPCALVSYSQGGPVVLLFLNLQTTEWKDKYIHSWTSYGGAFGGTTTAVGRILADWQPDSFKWLPLHEYHTLARSLGPSIWNLPYTETFGPSMMLVKTPVKTYTPATMLELLIDAQAELAAEIYVDLKVYQTNKPAPQVLTNCVFSSGLSTIVNMTYSTTDFEDDFVGGFSTDGDDCLLVEALNQCKNWAPTNVKPATAYPFVGVPHGDMTFSIACRNVLYKTVGVPIEVDDGSSLSIANVTVADMFRGVKTFEQF